MTFVAIRALVVAAVGGLAFNLWATQAQAQSFSQMLVFGDSSVDSLVRRIVLR